MAGAALLTPRWRRRRHPPDLPPTPKMAAAPRAVRAQPRGGRPGRGVPARTKDGGAAPGGAGAGAGGGPGGAAAAAPEAPRGPRQLVVIWCGRSVRAARAGQRPRGDQRGTGCGGRRGGGGRGRRQRKKTTRKKTRNEAAAAGGCAPGTRRRLTESCPSPRPSSSPQHRARGETPPPPPVRPVHEGHGPAAAQPSRRGAGSAPSRRRSPERCAPRHSLPRPRRATRESRVNTFHGGERSPAGRAFPSLPEAAALLR
ncbi:proapoptotic nucleolar protein 1-like [Chamaea fasciata]|uniref:proapoptotic nucleolar protein 1-like n=1 Tax=Chamaea fasciata TaxID=190680 RepID=UPI00336A367F